MQEGTYGDYNYSNAIRGVKKIDLSDYNNIY